MSIKKKINTVFFGSIFIVVAIFLSGIFNAPKEIPLSVIPEEVEYYKFNNGGLHTVKILKSSVSCSNYKHNNCFLAKIKNYKWDGGKLTERWAVTTNSPWSYLCSCNGWNYLGSKNL